eukprot:NODE_4570_length_768_cov_23.876755_g4411_i0.p1 GENE.NODE_4570_length_768_cov_23.876755_g4411_i0~~NODE_4570_length_768_cov_23.876755_g4411_i0.p1  ORF type:complete len:247 (+),score=45.05 NODE_4570_length_768_cov_23.876755_g4411_i0:3-743(+)
MLPTIVFLVGDGISNPGDIQLHKQLAEEHSVHLLKDTHTRPTLPEGCGLLLVSGSVGTASPALIDLVRSLRCGVICLSRTWWYHLHLTGQTGGWKHTDTIDMLPLRHFLSGDASGRPVVVQTEATLMHTTHNLAADALEVASGGSMFAYERGARLQRRHTAPGRRVGLWITPASSCVLNAVGRGLLGRAIHWVHRLPWSPATHWMYPSFVKQPIKLLLLLLLFSSDPHWPQELLFLTFEFLATDVP